MMIEFPFLGKSLQKYKDVIENEFEFNIHILKLQNGYISSINNCKLTRRMWKSNVT